MADLGAGGALISFPTILDNNGAFVPYPGGLAGSEVSQLLLLDIPEPAQPGILYPTTGLAYPANWFDQAGPEPAEIEFVSEQHINGINSAQTYASIANVQEGDLMLAFTSGAYRVTTPPAGWNLLGDTGFGGAAMANSVLSRVATSSAESVSFAFASSDSANFTSVVVFRNVERWWLRGIETFSASQGTAPLTFPVGANPQQSDALVAVMFVHNASNGFTWAIAPSPTAELLNFPGANNRNHWIWTVPPNGIMTATPSGNSYRAGSVIYLGQ